MKVEEGTMTQEEANKILDQSEVEYQKLQQGIEQTRQRQEAMNKVFEPLRDAIGIINKLALLSSNSGLLQLGIGMR